MRFYWLQDRVEQGQFRIFWAPGKINLADYQSKVQPKSVHRAVRPIYLYVEGKSPTTLQGCDKILEALSAGNATKSTPRLASTLKTTAQLGSIGGIYNQPARISLNRCNQAVSRLIQIHTDSLIQTVYNIAYPSNILL